MNTRRCVLAILTAVVLVGCHREPANVLLVTFDTTRWDHVGYATGRDHLTPMIDALAARGTWFETCVTPQPLTLPAHTSILSGMNPTSHGVRNNGTYIVSEEIRLLSEDFQSAGYTTHAVTSAFVLDSRFGLDQGFDSYDDDLSGGPKQQMFMFKEIPAEQTAAKTVRWLRDERPRDVPFFLWVHFFDPHADYRPPAEWAARFPGDPYSGEIAYADNSLGFILKELDDSGELESTIVVFTSDHGDGLGEHGEKTHSLFIYEATTRVPLLMTGPGIPVGERVDDLVRTIDIAPTLLELTGIGDLDGMDGRSLAPLWKGRSDDRVAYLETFVPRQNFGWSELRGLRTLRSKVILAPHPEVFDLDADPGETDNLLSGGGGTGEPYDRLFDELNLIVEQDPITWGEHEQGDLDQETKQKLAALGYMWGDAPATDGPLPDPKDRIEFWDRFQTAQHTIRAGDFEKALVLTESLLEDDPGNVIAMGSLATILMQLKQYDRAVTVFGTMRQLDPGRESSHLGLARGLSKIGRRDEAEEVVHEYLEIQPESIEAYTLLGDLALEAEEYPEAETWFRKALAIDENSSLAASGLGNCLNRSGQLEAARDLLAAYHRSDPTSHAIAYNLAVVSDRMGDPQAAIALYQEAIRLDPEHSMSWNNLGSLLAKSGRQQEALKHVAKAHQLDPENVEATYNLGAILADMGQPEKALHFVDLALVTRPDLIQAALMRARLLERLGRIDDALAQWRLLAAASPAGYLQIARIEATRGNTEAARRAVEEAIRIDGDRARQAALRIPALAGLFG